MYKWIVFDCMETLIDMDPIPRGDDYAKWAYEGSYFEKIGLSFEAFNAKFQEVKDNHLQIKGPLVEFNMLERLLEVSCKIAISNFQNVFDYEQLKHISENLYACFWNRYLNACFMRDDTFYVLEKMKSNELQIAVASNFTIHGGVEEILKKVGVYPWIDMVVASVDIGVRKPHPEFYKHLLDGIGVEPNQVLFIGDDYACDYEGPKNMGMDVRLYDPNHNYLHVVDRIGGFVELI